MPQVMRDRRCGKTTECNEKDVQRLVTLWDVCLEDCGDCVMGPADLR
jgi:hypothetical protein